jgi:hypothetical protein
VGRVGRIKDWAVGEFKIPLLRERDSNALNDLGASWRAYLSASSLDGETCRGYGVAIGQQMSQTPENTITISEIYRIESSRNGSTPT